MIYLLAFMLITVFLLMVVVTRGDFFHPAVIVPLVFSVSVLCCIYNTERWGVDLGIQTVLTILAGVALFCIVSYGLMERKPSAKREDSAISSIELASWQKAAILLFFVGVSYLYYRHVESSFSSLGVSGEDWNDAMYARRQASADTEMSSLTSVPTYVTYLYNTMEALVFVVLYIVMNNLFSDRGGFKADAPYYLCLVVYVFSVILHAGRLPILELVLAAVLMYWVIWHRKYGWKGTVRFSYILLAVLLVAGTMMLFTALRDVVGRQSDEDILAYITNYAGGSIQLFDMYLKNPASENVLFGQETFRGIWSALIRHLDIAEAFSWQLEFRWSNGICIGNVYTAFRYWIHDFGYIGFVVMTVAYAVFYTKFYSRVVKGGCQDSSYALTLYAFLFSGLVMLFIQDVLCAMDLNPGNIYIMLCIAFFDWLLIERPKMEIDEDEENPAEPTVHRIGRRSHSLPASYRNGSVR